MADAVGKLGRGGVSEQERIETREWLESLEYVLEEGGPDRVVRLLRELELFATRRGVELPFTANTPYINTIPVKEQVPYPGNREIERRIKSLVRWNALAMVVRANREEDGIGGHISTFASAATLYEVGFNHFFRGPDHECGGDLVYFQGHASPGIYSRAFMEGRLAVKQLENFRRELQPEGGLSSYPHPWLMPEFWQFPTVSMGLGPLTSLYQARFNRYLEHRGLIQPTDAKVWAFLGDGEMDEPESLGSISLAAREGLDNLIFVVNCNLQRLDGPVRGNGKIIQELEAVFRGAGWRVIKVIWGSEWDHLLEEDEDGLLVKRMEEVVDGQYQKYSVEGGAFIREDFFGRYPELLARVEHLADEELRRLKRGGHDPAKLYAAYKEAVENKGGPTVILAKTVKGYGLGEAGEGKNVTHQQKKLNEAELRHFRDRFGIPVSDEEVSRAPFYRPPESSPEIEYLMERRRKLGGFLPARRVRCEPLKTPAEELFSEFNSGTGGREVSTTMVIVRILAKLLRDKGVGKLIVPIVPDEARTFGLEALFSQVGIYSSKGQLYEPVDAGGLMYYREAKDGQILEEGITEAGSMSSFIAAGTAYATHGVNTIPFFLYYSMFGFQRVGDLIWLAGDIRCKGFLVGCTSGRTTLNGEGLQHEDGHSHLLAYPVPNLVAYDPAFAYEIAVIVREGIRRMFENQEDVFYYLTVGNENYVQPPLPDDRRDEIKEGIVRGIYRFRESTEKRPKLRVDLLGSGAILNCSLRAQELLADKYGVAADVWSVTSYKELHRSGVDAERWNIRHPGEKPREAYVTEALKDGSGVFVAASDYMKALPESVAKWVPGRLISLGTDGFGRSETRQALRDFFEVDHRHITVSALYGLMQEGKVDVKLVRKAIKELDIDTSRPNPWLL
jgi:pyruvate dehydrogenase E1 component